MWGTATETAFKVRNYGNSPRLKFRNFSHKSARANFIKARSRGRRGPLLWALTAGETIFPSNRVPAQWSRLWTEMYPKILAHYAFRSAHDSIDAVGANRGRKRAKSIFKWCMTFSNGLRECQVLSIFATKVPVCAFAQSHDLNVVWHSF